MHHPIPLYLMTVEQHKERIEAEIQKERVKATKQAANTVVRQCREAGLTSNDKSLLSLVEGRLRQYGVPRANRPAIAELVLEVI